jgi:AcrR family transcriptional regulator
MATQADTDASRADRKTERRTPLTRERILLAAVALADAHGLEAVSMRKVGHELGVEAMSLYNHVANKEDILEGMLDIVMSEIEEACDGFSVPANGSQWKPALRKRILTARASMLRHPWAPKVLETRTQMSLRMIRYADSLLGILKEGGFSYDLAHHAMHALGSRMLGFTQELFEPENDDSDAETEAMLAQMADQIPYVVGMMIEVAHTDPEDETLGWCDDQTEFEFGLDLILDGLDRLLPAG